MKNTKIFIVFLFWLIGTYFIIESLVNLDIVAAVISVILYSIFCGSIIGGLLMSKNG